MEQQSLTDLNIVDLSWQIPGPHCTKVLADYGAQVIKIERPGRGDPARMAGPLPGDGQPLVDEG